MNICTECGDECKVVEETFDYAGTHCTNGFSGTHHTGVWVSECCLAECDDDYPEDEDEDQIAHDENHAIDSQNAADCNRMLK